MKIASLGPHIVVPAPEENMEMAENLSQGQAVVAPMSQNEPLEDSVAEDANKGRFTRIYDLIQEAEKKKKIRMSKGDKKRLKVIEAYLAHVEPEKIEEVKGKNINQAS